MVLGEKKPGKLTVTIQTEGKHNIIFGFDCTCVELAESIIGDLVSGGDGSCLRSQDDKCEIKYGDEVVAKLAYINFGTKNQPAHVIVI